MFYWPYVSGWDLSPLSRSPLDDLLTFFFNAAGLWIHLWVRFWRCDFERLSPTFRNGYNSISTQWKAVTLGAGAFVCHNSRRSAWSGSVPPPQLARCSAVVALVGHSHDSFHVLLREGGRETETEALRSPQVFIIQRRRRRRRHTCSSEHTETAEKRL